MTHAPPDLIANGSLDRVHATGERRLMLATLEDAVRTILNRSGRHMARDRKLQDDLAWLMSDDALRPFGFLSLCDSLGIDPDYLRSRVLAGAATARDAVRTAVPRAQREPKTPSGCSSNDRPNSSTSKR